MSDLNHELAREVGVLKGRLDVISETVTRLSNPDAGATRVRLYFDFQNAMERLWKKYGVIEVQEMARGWVEFLDKARAINERHAAEQFDGGRDDL